MTPGTQQELLLETCTLLGCFVPPETYVPLALAALDDPEAPAQRTTARLTVLQHLLQGSGMSLEASCCCCC